MPASRRSPRQRRAAAGFADDSGLVVEALDGRAPGSFRRLGGRRQGLWRAMARIERLLAEARRDAGARSAARISSRVVRGWPDGHWRKSRRAADGTLVWPPRGSAGFGYDPMFCDGFERTFGEIPRSKSRPAPLGLGLSHRARVSSNWRRSGLTDAGAPTCPSPQSGRGKQGARVYVHGVLPV